MTFVVNALDAEFLGQPNRLDIPAGNRPVVAGATEFQPAVRIEDRIGGRFEVGFEAFDTVFCHSGFGKQEGEFQVDLDHSGQGAGDPAAHVVGHVLDHQPGVEDHGFEQIDGIPIGQPRGDERIEIQPVLKPVARHHVLPVLTTALSTGKQRPVSRNAANPVQQKRDQAVLVFAFARPPVDARQRGQRCVLVQLIAKHLGRVVDLLAFKGGRPLEVTGEGFRDGVAPSVR